jgi:hypothetical protein
VGWHQVRGAYLGQAVDQERQVTCEEVSERICINLGIFSKGAKQRAPRKRAEPLPKMGPPRELNWGHPRVGTPWLALTPFSSPLLAARSS